MDYNDEKGILVFSFPISHDLYTAKLKQPDYKVTYGGSNFANTIRSIQTQPSEMSVKTFVKHVLENDEYAAIKYDKFRKVYYRFLRHRVNNYTESSQWTDKSVSIIILDESLNYLGETNIGTIKNWYLQNAFVTEEGLNIEYIPDNLNEDYLIYKIFTLEKRSRINKRQLK
ncbi:DUF4221 family protein [Desertivirga xinjiangensis]|uniref:DUF4221 family protein n=1 Tax=Desertivirga xinjiangensis TaxID=539206 RepID=UPI00210F0969|nr:DUF4221 family protein [Pedobacter xinjiangensis]